MCVIVRWLTYEAFLNCYSAMATPTPGGLNRTYLPSDPDFLLDYMAGIGSDESDDEFDGYLTDEDEPLGDLANASSDGMTMGLNSPSLLPSSTSNSRSSGGLIPPDPSQQGKYS